MTLDFPLHLRLTVKAIRNNTRAPISRHIIRIRGWLYPMQEAIKSLFSILKGNPPDKF